MLEMFIYLMIPIVFSNILHMILVKVDGLSFLQIPINTTAFGVNKTWRGLLVLSLFNAFNQWIFNFIMPIQTAYQALILGFLIGVIYILFELPNSWIKRRMGIAPGEKSRSTPILFSLLDKSDSVIGICLLAAIYFRLTVSETLVFFILGVGIHILISALLVLLRIKRSF